MILMTMETSEINKRIREFLDMADEKGLILVDISHSPVQIDQEMHTQYVLILRE